jgi:hypothetical protein
MDGIFSLLPKRIYSTTLITGKGQTYITGKIK